MEFMTNKVSYWCDLLTNTLSLLSDFSHSPVFAELSIGRRPFKILLGNNCSVSKKTTMTKWSVYFCLFYHLLIRT